MPRETEPPVENKPENQCPACGTVRSDVLSKYCPKHVRELREEWLGKLTKEKQPTAPKLIITNLDPDYQNIERLWNRLLGPIRRG